MCVRAGVCVPVRRPEDGERNAVSAWQLSQPNTETQWVLMTHVWVVKVIWSQNAAWWRCTFLIEGEGNLLHSFRGTWVFLFTFFVCGLKCVIHQTFGPSPLPSVLLAWLLSVANEEENSTLSTHKHTVSSPCLSFNPRFLEGCPDSVAVQQTHSHTHTSTNDRFSPCSSVLGTPERHCAQNPLDLICCQSSPSS